MHCPILLKFGTLVQCESSESAEL